MRADFIAQLKKLALEQGRSEVSGCCLKIFSSSLCVCVLLFVLSFMTAIFQ